MTGTEKGERKRGEMQSQLKESMDEGQKGEKSGNEKIR